MAKTISNPSRAGMTRDGRSPDLRISVSPNLPKPRQAQWYFLVPHKADRCGGGYGFGGFSLLLTVFPFHSSHIFGS
jgi:hypothetical protein